jgi:hypothetical protein
MRGLSDPKTSHISCPHDSRRPTRLKNACCRDCERERERERWGGRGEEERRRNRQG